ncbi:hypothetical protein BRC84_07235 [Halobacteriales archaeon QS_1_68_44]|nr:MAG: hypothetical protein BRC84_07235 [Halobacteriales archaeon QS_1_68_44]
MPPTLVTVAVGVLLGVALLGEAFDRRSMAVVALAAAVPDLDAVLSLWIRGATNAALHTFFIPLSAAIALYLDTRREGSWLRVFNIESAAVLYPVSNRYFSIVGKLVLSTQEGVVQSYVEFGDGWLSAGTYGTTESRHISTWVNPTPGTDNPPGAERVVRVVDSGWQLVVVGTAAATLAARTFIERRAA